MKNRKLPESVILARRGRKVGSDDLQTAAKIFFYGAGLHDSALQAAEGVAKGLEAALSLALSNEHFEAAKKAKATLYVLNRTPKIGGVKVQCRDGRTRRVQQIVTWFAGVHFKIAADIEAAQEAEAIANAKAEEAAIRAAEMAFHGSEEEAEVFEKVG